MFERRCQRCPTGYMVARSDQYGSYRLCLMCGNSRDHGKGDEGSLREFSNLKDNSRRGMAGKTRPPDRICWSAVIPWGDRHYPAPSRCLWPDCSACGLSHQCCMAPQQFFIHCRWHATLFVRKMGAPAPRWTEMRLPMPYGLVEIEYIVERNGHWRSRGRAWVYAIRCPKGSDPSDVIRRLIRRKFQEDTGLQLEWLGEAIDAAMSGRPEAPRSAAL